MLNTTSLLIECSEKKTDQSNAHRHDLQAMKCVPFPVFSSCCFRQRVRTQACHRLLIDTRNATVNTITTIQMLVAAISKASSGSCRRIATSRMRSRRLRAYQKGIAVPSLAANKQSLRPARHPQVSRQLDSRRRTRRTRYQLTTPRMRSCPITLTRVLCDMCVRKFVLHCWSRLGYEKLCQTRILRAV